MNKRTVKQLTIAQEFQMGPMRVKQPLPEAGLEQVSPFILLHHAGPDVYAGGQAARRLDPHPHRGFEPVTFLFSGGLHHRDSLGNEGILEAGDVQWMTAGSGILHSEGPSAAFTSAGGSLELVQLWVNLPRDKKLVPPRYQDIKARQIPHKTVDGFTVNIVAGSFQGISGPALTHTPICAFMIDFEGGKEISIPLPHSFNTLVYVLSGGIVSNETSISALHMAVYENDGDSVQLKSTSAGRLLFLAGEPIPEPIASYGPFVMNYPGEIKQAILDYESGKMGLLDF
jgi:quercetin 2,3-dioxygenase